MAPVSAADFAPPAAAAAAAAQQQDYRRGPPQRASSPWSEWGTGVGGAWAGTRAAAWRGGRGSYDDNQVGFVDSSSPGHQEGGYDYHYHNGAREAPVPPSSPHSPTVPAPGPPLTWQRYEDLGSPYEDRGSSYNTYQVPVVQVHGPQQWTPTPAQRERDAGDDDDRRQGHGHGQGQGRGFEQQPHDPPTHPLRDLARASRGLSVNEEVSPLSSTGSGVPYPRMSAISGMGLETNARASRG